MRSSAVPCIIFLLRTLPSSITREAAAAYDILLAWTLASVFAGEGTGATELASLEGRVNPSLCRQQHVLGLEAPRQAQLSVREEGLGLTTSAAVVGAACIGCQALTLEHVLRDSHNWMPWPQAPGVISASPIAPPVMSRSEAVGLSAPSFWPSSLFHPLQRSQAPTSDSRSPVPFPPTFFPAATAAHEAPIAPFSCRSVVISATFPRAAMGSLASRYSGGCLRRANTSHFEAAGSTCSW